MTDQTKTPSELGRDAQPSEGQGARLASPRRRAFVRGAAAVPTILTLHSGAALARSSNLLDTTTQVGQGDTVNCLQTTGLTPVGPGKYDLGAAPQADVIVLSPNNHYFSDSSLQTEVPDHVSMCQTGGNFFTSSGQPFTLQQGGGLVSATALSSFTGTGRLTPTIL